MPVQVSHPGVYIDEQLSGVNAITPVATSVTAFIGMARRGRLNTPTQVTSLARFQALYGTDASMGELVPQVGQFFLNGGSTAWIMRIAHEAAAAAVTLNSEAGQPVLRLTANDAGEDSNLIRAEVDYDTANPEATFNLRLYRRLVGPTGTVTQDGLETFTNLSMNPASGRFVETVVNSDARHGAERRGGRQQRAGVFDGVGADVPAGRWRRLHRYQTALREQREQYSQHHDLGRWPAGDPGHLRARRGSGRLHQQYAKRDQHSAAQPGHDGHSGRRSNCRG